MQVKREAYSSNTPSLRLIATPTLDEEGFNLVGDGVEVEAGADFGEAGGGDG